jgi:hypothetical protein
METLNPKMDLASMNVGMDFEKGIFDTNYGIRESINSTSTLGRQVAAEEDTYGDQQLSGKSSTSGKFNEVFVDRTNMVVNPSKPSEPKGHLTKTYDGHKTFNGKTGGAMILDELLVGNNRVTGVKKDSYISKPLP